MRHFFAPSIVALSVAVGPHAFAQEEDLEIPVNAQAKPVPKEAAPVAVTPKDTAGAVRDPAPISGPGSEPRRQVSGSGVPGSAFSTDDISVSAYVQSQYEARQVSEDQLAPGGAPLNQDRFLVRRARLRLEREWEWAALTLELDGNTTRGPAIGLRRAEASLVYRNKEKDTPPLLMLTAGITEIPFGYELVHSARKRFFLERSTASVALFPGEPDVGVRFSGGYRFLRYGLAVQNGEPVDERAGKIARDPNAAKDVTGRIGVETQASEALRASGGASLVRGTGFHPGTDASKNATQWRDLNENGVIDSGEIAALPGAVATPSANFKRWALGADLELEYTSRLGLSRVYGELTVASNLDRGLVPADPVTTGSDAREFGYYVAFVQDVTRYGVIGFRMDYYDPNSDFLDKRQGKLVPSNQGIRTFSPLAGLVLPNRARLVFQYDHVRDSLARDSRGVPTDLKNDQWALRLQVEL